MKFKTSKTHIYIKSINEDLTTTPIVFLHGFTGNSNSWRHIADALNRWVILIDLPGHSKSEFINLNEEYSIDDFCSELYLLLNNYSIKKIDLVGYSMGGRIAMAFSSKHSNRINSLVLESSSLGIDDNKDKEDRYNQDLELCDNMEDNLNVFVDNWESKLLFKDQKRRNYILWEEQRNNRLKHNHKQLSKSLQVFSSGSMPYYEESFKYFEFPISIICGTDDDKYVKIGKEMMYMNKNAKQYIIAKSSHNTHLENPAMFLTIIKDEVFKDHDE